ncbi:MAG: glycosyltransferase [Candidatus Woesearchaeota archaeon]
MNIVYSIFVTMVWFFSTYFAVALLLTLLTNRKSLYRGPRFFSNEDRPKVTILVPVYNEGKKVKETIDSLKKVDYPSNKLEIIILNDGSKDDTSDIVNHEIAGTEMIFVDNKENKGKAATLNQGIALATGEFVATMDGDSEVSPEILEEAIPYFKREENGKKIGAVTVSVEVKNPKTLLQKIVEVEYVIGLALALRALSFFNAVHVTPGPFSIYKRSVLAQVGGFDERNIVEDHEIAVRMHRAGYKIANCATTKVRTISPGTFKELYVQRKRWYTGSLLTLWQYRSMMLKNRNGMFAFIYPYTYVVVTCGLLLFLYTIFLTLSNLIETISFYSLTNYNFLSNFTLLNIDLLKTGGLTILGFAAILITSTTAIIAMRLAKKNMRTRIPGFLGFIFLFFLYQIFWGSSIISAISRRKVKWR